MDNDDVDIEFPDNMPDSLCLELTEMIQELLQTELADQTVTQIVVKVYPGGFVLGGGIQIQSGEGYKITFTSEGLGETSVLCALIPNGTWKALKLRIKQSDPRNCRRTA